MAPKISDLNDHGNNNDNTRGSKSNLILESTSSVDLTESQHLLSEAQHAGEVSLRRQVALCAGLLASDGGLVFMQLMMLPTLQTLGVPVNSVTLPGCLSGIMCLVGLPVLGWLSDGGSNPHGRKKPAVLVSALVFMAGFSLVISGCGLHTWIGPRAGETGGETLKSTFLPSTSFILQNSTGSSFQASTHPFWPKSSEVASTTKAAQLTSEPQLLEDVLTRASPNRDRRSLPTGVSSYPTDNPEERMEDSSSADWMSDPLGLAIPFVGLLGILGFAFIDMGNDLNNSSQKSFVLACTPPRQHVSLLVVGVQLSALGGCVAAALGVTDLAAVLVQGSLLDTVPGKTLVQCAFFIVLTLMCVIITVLSVPSSSTSSPSHPAQDTHDVSSTSGDLSVMKYPHYGSVEDGTDRITPSTSAAVLLESGAVSWADRSLQASSKHLDTHSNRFQHSSVSFTPLENSASSYDNPQSSSDYDTSTETAYLVGDNSVRRNSFRLSFRHIAGASSDHETKKAKLFASNSIVYYAIERQESESSDSDSERGMSGSQMEEERSSCSVWDRLKSRQTRRLALICMSMFFMCGAWQSFNVCATDYLGKVIYDGDPDADPESQSYMAYQKGMRSGSLGVLILNGIYVVVNFMQKRLLTTAGPKVECLVVCGLQVASLITLLMTDNIVAYYVTSTVFGIFRSAMYTIPFMLANEICQEEAKRGGGGEGKANVGRTMALVTTMIPLSNLLVSSMTGPLISSSGDPASPLYYTIAATFVAAVVFVFT